MIREQRAETEVGVSEGGGAGFVLGSWFLVPCFWFWEADGRKARVERRRAKRKSSLFLVPGSLIGWDKQCRSTAYGAERDVVHDGAGGTLNLIFQSAVLVELLFVFLVLGLFACLLQDIDKMFWGDE